MFQATFDEVWLSHEIHFQRAMRAHAKKILLICPDEEAQTENNAFVARCEKQIERLHFLRDEEKAPYDSKARTKMMVFDYLDELSLQRRFSPFAYKHAAKQIATIALHRTGPATLAVANAA